MPREHFDSRLVIKIDAVPATQAMVSRSRDLLVRVSGAAMVPGESVTHAAEHFDSNSRLVIKIDAVPATQAMVGRSRPLLVRVSGAAMVPQDL